MEDILLVNDKMNYFEGDIVFKTEEVGKERNAIKDENLKSVDLKLELVVQLKARNPKAV